MESCWRAILPESHGNGRTLVLSDKLQGGPRVTLWVVFSGWTQACACKSITPGLLRHLHILHRHLVMWTLESVIKTYFNDITYTFTGTWDIHEQQWFFSWPHRAERNGELGRSHTEMFSFIWSFTIRLSVFLVHDQVTVLHLKVQDVKTFQNFVLAFPRSTAPTQAHCILNNMGKQNMESWINMENSFTYHQWGNTRALPHGMECSQGGRATAEGTEPDLQVVTAE